ncbi:MAG TPA: zf-HC2 domain-containing protein [Spirochaetota bacterium]|nr:zf-HC2 domain-containing protein [Spirochaetota bacterium]HQJ72333.1 zf-HC2 domain-containing protein [Spirochaetota bacterium]HRS76221.1 zf-HC2 domain-containing protein [Spirochaetota bacterium]HRT74056.1 zf-HC2 domain-containing protein [Spirochaetota bacterium]
MNKHLTYKDLAAYLAETMKPVRRERFEGHIRSCAECRKKQERLAAAIAPRYQHVRLNDSIQERIVRSWREIRSGETPSGTKGLLDHIRRYPQAVLASSAAAVIIVIGTILYWPAGPRRIAMTAGVADMGITLNEKPLVSGMKIYDGGWIRVPDKAVTRIVHGSIASITLVNRSDLSIDSFVREKAGRIVLKNSLHDGLLLSSIHGNEETISYEYITPNARIESLGTEFLLQTTRGMSLVIMKKDSVRVTPRRSRESIVVHAGEKCIISDSARIIPATSEELAIFENIDALRKGAYDHLLLPSAAAAGPVAGRGGSGADMSGKDSDSSGSATMKNDGSRQDDGADGKGYGREEREREARQQRMELKKQQMNEMRRFNRNNMNQQMRRGR